ncbi:hypothetical protein [Chlorogloeopsis fritschii]|uniref:hypothetical protein n=1 Tax=Chlorogloeopsis fritschii TaxID=1124 RepID=UPI000F8E47DA|nr:hypothetical protein [Chlorogloeopsis fritschii]
MYRFSSSCDRTSPGERDRFFFGSGLFEINFSTQLGGAHLVNLTTSVKNKKRFSGRVAVVCDRTP